MNLFDGTDLLETTSTEIKNRILKPGQMLRAIDTGALYYGDKDGKPTAFVGASTTSSGGVVFDDATTAGLRRAVGDKQWILKPTAKTFWTDASSPVAASYEAVVDGVYYLRKNAGSYIFRYHPVAAQLMPHTVTLYVDCDDWSQLGAISPRFVDSAKTAGWSWLIKSDLTATGNALWYGSGIRTITFSVSNYNSLIGTPDISTTQIAHFGLRIDALDTVSAAPMVKFYGIEITGAPVNGKGSIVIGADDALRTWYNNGLPILEKYGLKSYIAVIADKIGQPGFMTLDNLKDAVARGHQCVVHGPLDYATGANLRSKYANNIQGLIADLTYSRDYLLQNGLATDGSEKIYIYPQGVADLASYDTTIYDVLRSLGYVAARSTQLATQPLYHPYARERLDCHNAFMLPVIGHLWAGAGEAANISGIVSTISSVAARRQDAMLVFHEVRATPAINNEVSPANLETVCAAIATQISYGALENKTITQQLIGNIRDAVPLTGI